MQRSTPSPRRAYYPRTIAEPEIPATNFQLVHRFLGQTFARRFLIDRALGPPGHEPPPHNHLEINLDSHASMDIDLWVRAVGNHQVYTDWTSDDPEAHHTRVVLKAGRDVGIRVVSSAVRVFTLVRSDVPATSLAFDWTSTIVGSHCCRKVTSCARRASAIVPWIDRVRTAAFSC